MYDTCINMGNTRLHLSSKKYILIKWYHRLFSCVFLVTKMRKSATSFKHQFTHSLFKKDFIRISIRTVTIQRIKEHIRHLFWCTEVWKTQLENWPPIRSTKELGNIKIEEKSRSNNIRYLNIWYYPIKQIWIMRKIESLHMFKFLVAVRCQKTVSVVCPASAFYTSKK